LFFCVVTPVAAVLGICLGVLRDVTVLSTGGETPDTRLDLDQVKRPNCRTLRARRVLEGEHADLVIPA